MIINFLRSIYITSIILQLVEARYPYAPPEPNNENKCFEIGENANGHNECSEYTGYYIPQTINYSDYSSFTTWINYQGNTENEEFFRTHCNGSASSITSDSLSILCSYVVYEAIINNRCSQNNGYLAPGYACMNECQSYLNELRTICPNERFSSLENACSKFRNCGGPLNKLGTTKTNDKMNDLLNTSKIAVGAGKTPSDTETNKVADEDILNTPNESISTNENDLNNPNSSGKENYSSEAVDTRNTNNKPDNVNESNKHFNKNILYTLGFMIPLSLFIGFGLIYYHRKMYNKVIDVEKGSYSYQYSNNSGNQNLNSEHSFSSGIHNHNKIFSIGLTDPKCITTMNIPITNKNIDSREQDNMASNCVAELISTATMINAANNANNNIQPITPNEVNININTTFHYNTLNSHHSSSPRQYASSLNPSDNSFNSNSTNSLKRKLPTYAINSNEVNNNNIKNSSLKRNLPTQLNSLSPSSPDLDSTPIVDLSLSENDPLLHIKKTNSFYHSSVSSENKKYNSFIAPISPIVSESIQQKSSHSSNKKEIEKDGQTNQYTNHLLNKPEVDDIEEEEEEEEIDDNGSENVESEDLSLEETEEEENGNIGPSKIFNTNNNKTESTINNNGISVTVDKHSSKYNSAKIPLSVMTVVQEFEPRMEDELALKVNDRILLLKVFDDGWAIGLNQMTGYQGVFPMEYVVSSELIKSTNKFASQIEFRNALPSRTHSQAFSNFSFSSTTISDSVIRLSDSDFDFNNSLSKSPNISSSKYFTKSSMMESLRKSKLNNSSVIEDSMINNLRKSKLNNSSVIEE